MMAIYLQFMNLTLVQIEKRREVIICQLILMMTMNGQWLLRLTSQREMIHRNIMQSMRSNMEVIIENIFLQNISMILIKKMTNTMKQIINLTNLNLVLCFSLNPSSNMQIRFTYTKKISLKRISYNVCILIEKIKIIASQLMKDTSK